MEKTPEPRDLGWLIPLVLAVVILLTIPGCAQDRYLTAEQDAEMRENCHPHGCAVVPTPIWLQIDRVLRALSGQES